MATDTVAAGASISKLGLFREIGWHPHPGQMPIVRSTSRHRVVAAGRRFGKSEVGGQELVPEAMLTFGQLNSLQDRGKRREFWIVGPEYSDSEKEFRIVYNTLARLEFPFDKPGTYNNPLSGDMHISIWNGRFQVAAKSAKYPDTLVGEGLSGVIMSEAAKLKEIVWTKYIRPTLSDFTGWSFFSSTPEGKNWFYNLWQQGADPRYPNWDSWRRPSWLNPHVYRERTTTAGLDELRELLNRKLPIPANLDVDPEIIDLALDMSAEAFNQEIAADFTEFVGRVFKEFDEEVHVTSLEYLPDRKTFAAVDYGFTNPNVWLLLQVDHWNNVYVLDELYKPGLTTDEFAAEVKAAGLAPSSMIKFYPDPAAPGDSKQMSKLLRVPIGGSTGGPIKDRIDMIRRWLRVPVELQHLPYDHPERLPKLFIDRRCVNLIREFNDYRYPKSAEEAAAQGVAAPENPLKRDDHTPEALGRFFSGYFGSPTRMLNAGTRVRHSTMSR